MKKSGRVLVSLVIFLIATGYFTLTKIFPSGTWRYKITVNVMTPQGIKSGSSVREVNVQYQPGFLGVNGGGHASVIGEAVVIDTGDYKLYALLGNDKGPDYAYNIVLRLFLARQV